MNKTTPSKDKWGLSWQITPHVLIEATARGGDVARIEAAVKGA